MKGKKGQNQHQKEEKLREKNGGKKTKNKGRKAEGVLSKVKTNSKLRKTAP